MTVYTVSQAYLDGMDAAFRLPVLLEGEILNIDAETQAAVSLSASGMLGGCTLADVSEVSAAPFQDTATLEPDRMTASGAYSLQAKSGYISAGLSAAAPDGRGEYPISGAAVTLEFGEDWHYYTGKGELTLLVPGAARIQIDVVYDHNYPPKTFSQTYAAEGDALVIDDLPTSEWYSNVTVTVLALRRPQWRARVRRAYFGRVETLDGGEILSLQYTDTSDGAMLQLPQRSAVLSVCNADGRLDQLAEYDNPTYRKWFTQAVLRIGETLGNGAVEWVPLGRFFMESYTVQKSRVDFVFQSAIGLLNDFTFYWERTGTLASRIQNLLYLDTDIESNGQKPQTDAERFGIRLRTGQAVNLTYAPGACTPLVTSAAYLQLAANASGNLMRPLRTGEDIELFPLSQDGDPLRAVRLDRCFDGVQWTAEEKPGALLVTLTEREADAREEIWAENAVLNSMDMALYSSANLLKADGLSFTYTEGDMPYVADQFTHAAYVSGGYKADVTTGVTIKAQVYGSRSADDDRRLYDSGAASVVTLSNPFLPAAGGGTPLDSTAYAGRMYTELKNHLTGSLSHRGYPELDAGDIVALVDEDRTVRARVLENTLTLSNGVMRGTTKVRRLS